MGLGNIWTFPYPAGSNGGGTFTLIYLVAIVLISLPILIAELAIGRRGRVENLFRLFTTYRWQAAHHRSIEKNCRTKL